jgi:hypothetical protein
MADSLWDRVKDFAFKHSPEWLQGRVDENAPVYRAQDARNEAAVSAAIARMADETEREQALGEMSNTRRWPHWDAGTPDYPGGSGLPPWPKQAAWERGYEAALEANDKRNGTWEPADTIRLYRIGPLPDEASKPGTQWLREYERRMGLSENIGRWFTSDEAAAEFHRFDHPARVMRHVDVTPEQAHAWRADTLKLERHTDHPTIDFFLPRDVANTAIVTGAERTILPVLPEHKPTQTVDYIETTRFNNKHHTRQPIEDIINRDRDPRQQEWKWDR